VASHTPVIVSHLLQSGVPGQSAMSQSFPRQFVVHAHEYDPSVCPLVHVPCAQGLSVPQGSVITPD
jgi:hypothetical protein